MRTRIISVGDPVSACQAAANHAKNLNYNPKEVFDVKDPHTAHLPKSDVSSTFIFGMGTDFFAYPNNYNYFVNLVGNY